MFDQMLGVDGLSFGHLFGSRERRQSSPKRTGGILFSWRTSMGCRRDVPERETANTNINPRILLYCVDIKNKMAFKRQLLTLFPQYLFILMFKMQFKACFKFCLIFFLNEVLKCVLNAF